MESPSRLNSCFRFPLQDCNLGCPVGEKRNRSIVFDPRDPEMQQSGVLTGPLSAARKRLTLPGEVLALAIVIAVPFLIYRSIGPGSRAAFGSNYEQMAIARSVVTGHGFGNPFGYTTGPTAAYTPVHPLILAGILFLRGNRPPAALVLVLTEIAIQTSGVVLLLYIAKAAFASWIPGAIAACGVLLCTWPLPQWESSTAWLAFEAVFLCALAGVRWGWTGAVMGLGWLVSPALGPASLAMVWVVRGRKYVLASAALAAILIVPWAARNWLVLRAPILLRDNFGLELFLSNNDFAGTREEDAEAERYGRWHPGSNAAVASELARVGEPEYFRRLQSDALSWIRRHPRRFLKLTIARIWMWWASSWLVAGISLLAFAGLWIHRRTAAGKAALAGLLLFPVPYYVIQFNPRYTYPALWLAALMAGDVCFRLFRRFAPAKAV